MTTRIRLTTFPVSLDKNTKKLFIPVKCRSVLNHIPEIISFERYNDAFNWVSVTLQSGYNSNLLLRKIREGIL